MELGVKLAVQNNTNELLTVEACQAMSGQWVGEHIPQRGAVVLKQSSILWSMVGEDQVVGAIHAGTTKGYLKVYWDLSISQPFNSEVTIPERLHATCELNRSDPQCPILILSLYPEDRPPILEAYETFITSAGNIMKKVGCINIT